MVRVSGHLPPSEWVSWTGWWGDGGIENPTELLGKLNEGGYTDPQHKVQGVPRLRLAPPREPFQPGFLLMLGDGFGGLRHPFASS